MGAVCGLSHPHQGRHTGPGPGYVQQAGSGCRDKLKRIYCSWSSSSNALRGPSLDNNSAELVADWSKADMTKLKDRLSRVNCGEEGMNFLAEAEWDKFKEISDREVAA